ncbi:hypothetical protein JQC92_02415 [Shewanella sp. 202IG2-18]|uniref:hypothetical protein n=1 Tax=Parashewanella hymeniacidonis TaxID=2807618 RepID=UPI001961C4BC|nr:hypothetical protein [Parashewanella hymeniacidonis]MBM7070895.1 hypothetical protein [Parashewanella hymeniacidonis]
MTTKNKSTMQSISATGELIVAGLRVNQEALQSKAIDPSNALVELNKACAVMMEKTDVEAEVRNALMFAGTCILQQTQQLKEICSTQQPTTAVKPEIDEDSATNG